MTHGTPSARRAAARLVLAAVLCASVSACGARTRGSEAAADTNPLTLQIGTALPRQGVRGGGVPAVISGLFSEPLMSSDRNGRVLPRLAEHWDWLDDGRVLKITLPAGVTFHDGAPLDAATVIDVLRARFAQGGVPTRDSVTRMDAADPRTILIHLSRKEPFLPGDLADAPIVRGTVGTGAFKLEGRSMAADGSGVQSAALVAFDAYRQGRPHVSRINVKAYPTLRGAWTAMMRSEINMLYEVSRDAADFVEQQSASVRSYSFPRPYVFHVRFNLDHPILGRRDVRQALSEAIDRPAIVRDAMNRRGEPADGPVWKYHWAYSTAQRTYQHNPEAARLRLDGAGLTTRVSTTAMPTRFTFTCLLWAGDPRFERIMLVLQKQLYDIGVDMRVETVTTAQLIERMNSKRYDAYLMEHISGPSLNWLYQAWHSPNNNTTTDRALERLRTAVSDDEQREAVSGVQRSFYEDPPALFLAWPQVSRAVSVDIDVAHQADSDIIGRIWRFRRAAPQVAER